MDRDRNGLPALEGVELLADPRRALPEPHPFVPDDRREGSLEVGFGVPTRVDDRVLVGRHGRRRQHVRRGCERDVETGGDRAECVGGLDRVGGAVLERSLEELDVPVPTVPGFGQVRGDRGEGCLTVGVLPRRVPEWRRHLVEAGRQEMSREHPGPLVAGGHPHGSLHDGHATHDDRLVRLIHLDRVALRTRCSMGPSRRKENLPDSSSLAIRASSSSATPSPTPARRKPVPSSTTADASKPDPASSTRSHRLPPRSSASSTARDPSGSCWPSTRRAGRNSARSVDDTLPSRPVIRR